MSDAVLAELARAGCLSTARLSALFEGGAALDEQVLAWQSLGVPIRRESGGDLRWEPAPGALSADLIGACLRAAGRPCLVTVEPLLDSTNARLLAASADGAQAPMALLAECQHAGRGRLQRAWQARFGEALLCSLLVACRRPVAEMPGLAIVAGVTLARVLDGLGVSGIGLKWPNDVLRHGAKLAGILVEAGGRAGHVVIGIGVNWTGADRLAAALGRPVAELGSSLSVSMDRNALAVTLIGELLDAVEVFSAQGLAPFVAGFDRYDALKGRPIEVRQPGRADHAGVAAGLADDGGLRVLHEGEQVIYRSAEISVLSS